MYPNLVFELRCHLQTACANNKGADQLRSLINAFVVHYLENMIT